MNKYDIVVLGAESVGKSSLIMQFKDGIYNEKHVPTLHNNFNYVCKLSNGTYRKIDILDIGGDFPFPAMLDLSVKLGHSFVVVYSVADQKSFATAVNMCNHIYKIKGTTDVRVCLVGNKIDLSAEKRRVSTELGTEEAKTVLKCQFVETSAKLNINVSSVFNQMLQSTDVVESSALHERKTTNCGESTYSFITRKIFKRNSICLLSLRSRFQFFKKKEHVSDGSKLNS